LALVEEGDLRASAMVNCREALARRQALIDAGELSFDFPIPERLLNYFQQVSTVTQNLPSDFVPLLA